jgi:glycosyltransferase involved in cell wall biosynthesis
MNGMNTSLGAHSDRAAEASRTDKTGGRQQKKKLLTISSRAFIDQSYGPTVHFIELWNEFHKRFSDQWDVTGICFYRDRPKDPAVDIEFEHRSFRASVNRLSKNVLCDLKTAGWLLFKIHTFDLIYMRTEPFVPLTYILIRLFKKTLIVEANSSMKDDVKALKVRGLLVRFAAWQERKQVEHAALSIAVSAGIAQYLKTLKAKKIVTITNGVASKYFGLPQKRSGDGSIKVVYVGTYAQWSGVIHIVELAEKFPEVEFYIYGEGQFKAEVERAIRSDNVHLVGYVEYKDLPDIYQKYDASIVLYTMKRNEIVLSSIKTMEYMACGLPIFATDVPGQEYIGEHRIGVLTDLENIEDNFRSFIKNLDTYKMNVESFRHSEGQKYRWSETARLTGIAIDSVTEAII